MDLFSFLLWQINHDGSIQSLKPPIKKESTSTDIIQQIFASNDNPEEKLDDSGNCKSVYDIEVQTTVENEESKSRKQKQHAKAHFVEIGELNQRIVFVFCKLCFNLNHISLNFQTNFRAFLFGLLTVKAY